MKSDIYTPINCDFHDGLLEKATFKTHCKMIYLENESEKTLEGIITDVFTKKKEEFLVFNKEVIIRLDKIIEINGQRVPKSNTFCAR